MLPIFLFLVTLQNFVEVQTIFVTNGDTNGDWGIMEVCGQGTVARGFRLKTEQSQGAFADDTALNGIILFCTTLLSSEVEKIIMSSQGEFGVWGTDYWCKSGAYLTSFSLRVEPQGHVDDTAANNIMFKCSDGCNIEGDGLSWGDYGPWSESCETGIRGIQTKVQKYQGIWYDDVALTDVTFTC